MGAVIIIAILLLIYFIPTIVAGSRDHPQGLAIFILNLLLGWTALGWVLALIWGCTAVQRQAARANSDGSVAPPAALAPVD